MTYGRNKVFIGGISGNVSKEEIEREFGKYGKLNSVWVAQNPPGFAFVEYMDDRDAKEAIKQLNGQTLFNDNKVRVEHSKDRPAGRAGGRGPGSGGFRNSRGANLGGGYRSGGRGGNSGGSGFKNSSGRFSDRREGRFGNSSSGSRFGSSGGSNRDRYNGESYNYRSRSPLGQTGRRY